VETQSIQSFLLKIKIVDWFAPVNQLGDPSTLCGGMSAIALYEHNPAVPTSVPLPTAGVINTKWNQTGPTSYHTILGWTHNLKVNVGCINAKILSSRTVKAADHVSSESPLPTIRTQPVQDCIFRTLIPSLGR
jgi:hypothetical protein